MTHTLRRAVRAAAILTAALAPSLALAQKHTIGALAPRDAMIAVGCDDASAAWEAFSRTGFSAIWNDPAFRRWFDDNAKQFMEGLTKTIEDLGIDKDDLRRPTGPVGAYIRPTAAFLKGDFEDEEPHTALLFADFGDEAAAMHDALIDAAERAARRKTIELRDHEHDGVTVHHLVFPSPEDEDAGDAPAFENIYLARSGGVIIAATHKDAVEDALDRLAGDKHDSIDDEPLYNDALNRAGRGHAYGAVITGPLLAAWQHGMQQQAQFAGPMAEIMATLFTPLGLTDITAAAASFRFDADDAMLEQKYALLIPRKRGLVSLLDAPSVAFEPPAFIGPAAAGATMFQFNFAGVIPLINRIVEGLPQDIRDQAGGMIMGVSMTAGPILANLGPEVWVVNTLARPLNENSSQSVVAIRVRDAGALRQALEGALPLFGFESRDFQGNQIWAPAGMGMLPVETAAGIGFGHFFIGAPAIVENALRQAGAEGPRLATEPAFRAAARALQPQGLGHNYTSMRQTLDWLEWSMANAERIIRAQMNQIWGDDRDLDEDERRWRDEAIRGGLEGIPAWYRNPPPMDVLRRHMGDTVSEFHSTADGFTGRTLLLRPARDN